MSKKKKPVCNCGTEMTKMWVCLKCCSRSYKDKCTGFMMYANEEEKAHKVPRNEEEWREYWEAQYEQG